MPLRLPLARVRARPEVWALTAVSIALHFVKLYDPNAVVFDELHYERFTGDYLHHQYLFDVHPPLGRLLLAGAAALMRIPAAKFIAPEPVPLLRALPAAFGAALVPLIYLLLRQLGANRRIATLGATLLLLENALLVLSRIIVVDVVLIAFGMMALTSYLAARRRSGPSRWAWLTLSAALAGASLSVKWTGASALGMILAAWFVENVRGRRRLGAVVREAAVLTLIPAMIYVGAFGIHFAVLSTSGPGDIYMPADFRATLPGDAQFVTGAKLSFWKKLAEVHRAMRVGNLALEHATNPGASPWYTWPMMQHPISLWGDPQARDQKQMLILLGNPVVWWGVLVAFVAGVLAFVWRRQRWKGREFAFLFLVGGILLNYVPFMAIKRIMYLYHYLFALTLLIVFGAYTWGVVTSSIDDDAPPWRFTSARQGWAFAALVGLVLAGFIYFAPFTYGWTISNPGWEHRFWVLHPRF
jgi:dolichyl-phosphate-mannose-protein mannosyltransferase